MRSFIAAVSTVLVALVIMMGSASATKRVADDFGGQIGPYLENLKSMRAYGEHFVIDGPCLSACTMILGVIPRDHVCVTPHARLGFHAAWRPDESGREVKSPDGTQLLMSAYAPPVKSWIMRHGGLSRKMMYLQGRQLTSMYPPCAPESQAPYQQRW